MRVHGKIVAIVQARLGSTRLPMKSLLCLRDSPLIDWVLHRLAQAKRLDAILVALPQTAQDRVLWEHVRRRHVDCVVGPEQDVLERFRLAACQADAQVVVRVCADNPLLWGPAIDRLVDFYQQGTYDYAYNHIPRHNTWPDGLGAEIFSRELLEHMAATAQSPQQREHCCNYLWDHADEFRFGTFDPEEAWLRRPDLKLDVDTAEDFCRMALHPLWLDMDARAIVDVFGGDAPTGKA